MTPQAKRIVLCSDGTGNTAIKDRGTNVFKLFEAVDVNGHRSNGALPRQLAFYDDGVGTESLSWVAVATGATGYGLSRNVKKLYRELCRVYEPGDDVYLFGFSRGAFTVRTLAGLISDCGLVDPVQHQTEDSFRRQTDAAYAAYRCKYRAWLTRMFAPGGMGADEFRRRFARPDAPPQPIRLLGVWDTVDAVGLPFQLADVWNRVVWQYKFETSTLPAAVRRGCQALALDDERGAFTPVLWDERDPSTRARVEQVWFAGAHANVGGGYPQQGMSLVALDWMMKRAEEEDLRFVATARMDYEWQHSFADRLYEPRAGLGVFYRWKPRDVQALCAARGITTPAVHVSAIERVVQAPSGYAPGNLPPRLRVVTTEAHPCVRVDDVAQAIADAHGSADAPPLVRQEARLVQIGFAAYLTFIGGILAALTRAGYVAVSASGALTVAEQLVGAGSSLPWVVAVALWSDRAAAGLLFGGLALGYVLSSWSDSRMTATFSRFWHQHRATLRTALRRTPSGEGTAGSGGGAR